MIELVGLSVTYDGADTPAVAGLDLKVNRGEVVVLTGPSGSGKSTVVRVLNGLVPGLFPATVTGTAAIDGTDLDGLPLHDIAETVGTVFQNPRTQFFALDVTDELAFTAENLGLGSARILSRMEDAVDRFGLRPLLDRGVFHLSGGEKQLLACASVTVAGPQVVLLDEPSANLDPAAVDRLAAVIKLWRDDGVTVVIAEHRLHYLTDLMDRVVVLDGGQTVVDLSRRDFLALSVGQLFELGIRPTPPAESEIVDVVAAGGNAPSVTGSGYDLRVMRAERRGRPEPILDVADIDIPAGSVLAVIGHNGAGKTTFARCLCGLDNRCHAQVYRDGRALSRGARLATSFLVMQDVNHQLFAESVLDEVLMSMPQPDRGGARELLSAVGLHESDGRHPTTLSGGQKQRLAVACAVASERDLVIFDEPTSGLDAGRMREFAGLLDILRSRGHSCVVVTHDTDLVSLACTHVVRLDRGRVRAIGGVS
jgi:energy-coupling factor transport system ATP-binding protein